MKTNQNKIYRYLLILPLVVLMTLAYSCKQDKSSEKKTDINSEVNKIEEAPAVEVVPEIQKVLDFQNVDVQPTVLGVDESLSKEEKSQLLEESIMNHVKENIIYPEDAKDEMVQGKVLVSFVYGEDGKVKDAEVVEGISESLDKEALRIVNSLPDVNPAYHNGKKVPVNFKLPITFKLE